MNLSRMTDDLNIIQTLADQPTIDSPALKSKFDEAGNAIKDYINNILTIGIENGTAEDIKAAKNSITNYVDGQLEKVSSEVNSELTTFKTNIENTVNTKITALEKKITNLSGKLGVDVTQLYLNDNLGNKTGTLSSAYTNYTLLLIVGRNISNNKSAIVIPTSRITTAFKYETVLGLGDYDVNLQVHFDSTTKFTATCSPDSSSSQVGICEVYGIGKKQ